MQYKKEPWQTSNPVNSFELHVQLTHKHAHIRAHTMLARRKHTLNKGIGYKAGTSSLIFFLECLYHRIRPDYKFLFFHICNYQ